MWLLERRLRDEILVPHGLQLYGQITWSRVTGHREPGMIPQRGQDFGKAYMVRCLVLFRHGWLWEHLHGVYGGFLIQTGVELKRK